jgi:hypothetical protein
LARELAPVPNPEEKLLSAIFGDAHAPMMDHGKVEEPELKGLDLCKALRAVSASLRSEPRQYRRAMMK